MAKSRQQEEAFHWLIRECAVQYLEINGLLKPDPSKKQAAKSFRKSLHEIESTMKAAAKLKAYLTGLPQFSKILLPKSRGGGTSNLDWHDYSTIINIVYRDFYGIFGVEPPPLERDKTWNAEN